MERLQKLAERIVSANDAVNGLVRRAITWWLRIPPGPYAVHVISGVRIAMPDGIHLVADHYAPALPGPQPAILIRTPYGRGGPSRMIAEMYAWQFAAHGYHVIIQDTRGRCESEGEFVPFVHEADDGAATLEWMAAQPWCAGVIGMWGASYLGYTQWAAAKSGAPYLRALVPIITRSDLMYYPANGFPLDLLLRWMFQIQAIDDPALSPLEMLRRINDARVQDRYLGEAFAHLPVATADEVVIGRQSPLYREMAESGPDHPVWAAVDHRDVVPKGPPACFISGWYDLFLDGLLEDFRAQQEAGLNPQLTVGPWHHLDYGYLSIAFREALGWFDAHLRGLPQQRREHPIRLYVMGANRWRAFDHWPPPAERVAFFLHGSGAAKTGRLFGNRPPAEMAPDHYRYDPADPTPNLGGPKLANDAGAVDNRPLEGRADVLVFSSLPLAADLEIAGPVTLELYVRSSRPTADFFGRLCDVDRKGNSRNICDGLLRVGPGKGDVQPDGSLRITVAMSATAYCFKAGHRIRLQVSSGAHPRFARNLGVEGPQTTTTVMFPADQTVYHDAAHPSALFLPVVTAPSSLNGSEPS